MPSRVLLFMFLFPTIAFAQTEKLPIKLPKKTVATRKSGTNLDTQKVMRLNYGLPDWNKDSTQIDSASIMLREGNTGRVVQINLEETAPDSSQFSGLYSVQWEKITEMAPEFYVPPQELLGTPEGAKKLSVLVQQNKLKRAPFIIRRGKNGEQIVELFDTPEQARDAMKAFREERAALEMQSKPVVNEGAIEAARIAAEAKAREEAAKAAADRARLAQMEARKAAEQAAAMERMNAAEQEKRRQAAQKLAAEAIALYKEGKFKAAANKFEQAVEQDPTNKTYYYQFGVSLYRIDNFNKSLVYISLAEGSDVNPVEKEFYRGLNFFKLKDIANARSSFKKVEDAKNPDLSPSAAFYNGMIEFDAKKWSASKLAFQRVLDTSKDPRLDERADDMIERILRIQYFEAEKAKKWTLSGTFGTSYDSNVLQVSTSQLDSGTSTNTKGIRTLQQASLRYRPIYERTNEFAVQLDLLNMYTLDSSFKSDQNLRNADPLVLTLQAPVTWKGTLFKKGHKLDLIPGAETIYMSVENNENKAIVNSFFLNAMNTFVMSEKWFANVNLETRNDQSQLDSSTGDDDSTAMKFKLGNSNYFFMNEDKSKILLADVAYSINQAKGKNSKFNRYDLGVGYIGQTLWELTYLAKLGYFNLNYPSAATVRKDSSFTLTLGLSKKLSDKYSAGWTTSYNSNSSNIDSNEYTRITSMLTFSANWQL